MKNLLRVLALFGLFLTCSAESCDSNDSNSIQSQQQEVILQQATNSVGMPNIKNLRERKLLKQILEMRDQEGLLTYTYITDMSGKLHFFCNSFGFPIPYSTQYTNPSYIADRYSGGYAVLPQADPNALFSPSSAEGTWVMCKDPNGDSVKPTYVEPRIVTSQFKLD